jgi:hypothetical protein
MRKIFDENSGSYLFVGNKNFNDKKKVFLRNISEAIHQRSPPIRERHSDKPRRP